ncbi:MAG: hypothetical protein IT209_00220 [Armatimonadetes bacterium]|nr:hypothetical protein [Armatimonadota bacterium]
MTAKTLNLSLATCRWATLTALAGAVALSTLAARQSAWAAPSASDVPASRSIIELDSFLRNAQDNAGDQTHAELWTLLDSCQQRPDSITDSYDRARLGSAISACNRKSDFDRLLRLYDAEPSAYSRLTVFLRPLSSFWISRTLASAPIARSSWPPLGSSLPEMPSSVGQMSEYIQTCWPEFQAVRLAALTVELPPEVTEWSNPVSVSLWRDYHPDRLQGKLVFGQQDFMLADPVELRSREPRFPQVGRGVYRVEVHIPGGHMWMARGVVMDGRDQTVTLRDTGREATAPIVRGKKNSAG